MKVFQLSIYMLVLMTGLSFGQNKQTPYEQMIALSKEGMSDQDLREFIASLSKKEFKNLLIEYRSENPPSSKINVFSGMSMLSIHYYEFGAGEDDTYDSWTEDIMDTSYPVVWRQVILGHPPNKVLPKSPAQKKDYQQLLCDIFTSRHEHPALRREALLDVQLESLSQEKLKAFASSLKDVVTASDQDTGLIKSALRKIVHFIKSAEEKAVEADSFRLAEAIESGNQEAIAGNQNLTSRQKQLFILAAILSKDFGEIIDDLDHSTNLSNHFLIMIQQLRRGQTLQMEN